MSSSRNAGRFTAMETLECRRFMSSTTLRVVAWNIEADVSGNTTPLPGVDTVLEGIGAETKHGAARPIDVLSLEETTSNATTVAPIVAELNSFYGAGTYAMSTLQGTEVNNSPTTGNGPSAMIYNTTTVRLLHSVGVGSPLGSANGEYRQPLRYEFQPVTGNSPSDFYVYVVHSKSGTGTTNALYRGEEAQIIRTDAATLGDARVLYMGDFNASDVSETYYQTLTASGTGQAFDPENPNNLSSLPGNGASLLTESSTNLRYRDDFQFSTADVLNGVADGLALVPGTYHAFGNDGSIPATGNVTSTSNTALAGLPNQAAVLAALGTASDHLPVVADYTDPAFETVPHTIVAWDMAGQLRSGTQGLPPTKVDPFVTVSQNLTRGTGLRTSLLAPGNAWGGSRWGATAAAGSMAHETINFGVTVDPGSTMSLSGLHLNYRRSVGGPTAIRVQYQLHGGTWTTLGTAAVPSADGSGGNVAVDFSHAVALQNVTSDALVSIRLIPYGASTTGAAFYIYNKRGSDLELDGTINDVVA